MNQTFTDNYDIITSTVETQESPKKERSTSKAPTSNKLKSDKKWKCTCCGKEGHSVARCFIVERAVKAKQVEFRDDI